LSRGQLLLSADYYAYATLAALQRIARSARVAWMRYIVPVIASRAQCISQIVKYERALETYGKVTVPQVDSRKKMRFT